MRVGLALGGGVARGLAHIGVLEVLEREKIPIDMIAGTSAGALIGALYARGSRAGEIKEMVTNISLIDRARMIDLALPKTGLIVGERIKKMLKELIGEAEFKDLKIPFACVATDIVTGEEVVIEHGFVVEAVRASISIPAVFTVVKHEGKFLVDGGLANPVPVSVLKEMAADFTIAVNVIPTISKRRSSKDKKSYSKDNEKEPNIFNVLLNMIEIANHRLAKGSISVADIVIEPDTRDIGSSDFGRAREIILKGELAAIDAVPKIKKHLSLQ
jgi:NTE family protein